MIPTTANGKNVRVRKPRASGDDPSDDAAAFTALGVNPARAGMIPRVVVVVHLHRKPRASGDDPYLSP